jgi:hypothetical protein
MLWFLVLASCGNCDALCLSTSTVVLETVPDEPFEVVLEQGPHRFAWSCPEDTGDLELVTDCAAGTFQVTIEGSGDLPDEAQITVAGESSQVIGDCERSRKCGSTCLGCTFTIP